MLNVIISFLFFPFVLMGQSVTVDSTNVLSKHEFSLNKRYEDPFVNGVFKDNILLTMAYLSDKKIEPSNVDWESLRKPFQYRLILKPGETFAFHDDVMPKFAGKISKTTNTHFNTQEGFKSSGYLVGDGVCHLASLLYWVAQDAGLEKEAIVPHNFANIPQVPKEYGVSIYAYPGSQANDQMQNLYITNNHDYEVAFDFSFDGENLKITAFETL